MQSPSHSQHSKLIGELIHSKKHVPSTATATLAGGPVPPTPPAAASRWLGTAPFGSCKETCRTSVHGWGTAYMHTTHSAHSRAHETKRTAREKLSAQQLQRLRSPRLQTRVHPFPCTLGHAEGEEREGRERGGGGATERKRKAPHAPEKQGQTQTKRTDR